MGKFGAAILGLCAGLALTGCGGSDTSRSDSLGDADWMLTITSPAHGSTQKGRAMVRVAVAGEAAARGEAPDFDIGYFVNDRLEKRTRDTSTQLLLPKGSYALRVEGVDANGQVLERVVGDEVMLEIGELLQMDPVEIPASPPIDRRGRAGIASPPRVSPVDVPDVGTPIPRGP